MLVTMKNIVENWWNGLDYDYKVDLLAEVFPNEAHLIEADEQWGNLDFEDKYEIYRKSDNEVELTEEDIEAQRTDAAEKENHRKEVED